MGVGSYSTTPASNTLINGINIGEGCAPSGINDAIRQLMADIATYITTGAMQIVAAAGTADIITATYAPAIPALTDQLLCVFVATAANATATPSFNPNGLGAKTITKKGGKPLVPGDIPGALACCILEYNLANTRWELLNPASTFDPWVVSGGTSDVITATYVPAIPALYDGLFLSFRATAANTTTTPTFNPNGLGAGTITKRGGTALVAGEIPGNLYECLVVYNLANTRWELLNPAPLLTGSDSSAAYASTQFVNGAGVPIRKVTKQVLTSSGTYTAPAGLVFAIVEVCGGGGGGGGSAATGAAASAAGGGGSGSYSKSLLTGATIGASQTTTVGAAGAAGAAGNNNGGSGGASSFGALVTANGGSGGGGSGGSTAAMGIPGIGGCSAGTGNMLAIAGQPGGGAITSISGGGFVPSGGMGGSTPLGMGASNEVFTASGGQAKSGVGYGAGGAGAALGASNSASSGGAGTQGVIIVTEFCTQ